MKQYLAVVDIDIHANQDETAREQVLERLRNYKGSAVTPLWITWLRVRADLRLVCLVGELEHFDDFLIDEIRCVPGVRGTHSFLSFDGVVHGDVIEDIPLQDSPWSRRASATAMIQIEPGKECSVYEALVALPRHNEVEVGYVAKLFHCHICDAMVLLIGERTASLSGYVMSWIRSIPGVTDTEVVSTLDWKVLARTEDLIALCQSFPETIKEG
jgi:DNA-binding Lrp family transcriptional regulator